MNFKPKMVLIDLDGTLVDSVPDLAYCVDGMMKRLGLRPHGEEKVRDWVGNGVERLVKRALVGELEGEPEEQTFQKALPLFLELYDENISQRSHLYPGAREALEFLKNAGIRRGCVTNKAARFTEPLLRHLGVLEDFQVVVSGDTLEKQKPDPAPLIYAARALDVAPADSLMVGDSVSDVTAARAAGFSVVCVTYGYNHGQDVADAHPDALIDSLAELESLVGAEASALSR